MTTLEITSLILIVAYIALLIHAWFKDKAVLLTSVVWTTLIVGLMPLGFAVPTVIWAIILVIAYIPVYFIGKEFRNMQIIGSYHDKKLKEWNQLKS